MYQNKHGRFTAPDPLLASASPANPQTFNRYIYTGNNPINYTDPGGLEWCRNEDGSAEWTGKNNPCSGNQEDVTGKAREVERGGCDLGECVAAGDIIHFHSDGTMTIIRNPTGEQTAIAQGRNVVNATVNVTADSASDVASGAALTNTPGVVGTTITQQELLPLPCLGGSDCGDISSQPVDLTIGASTDEMLDTVEILAAGLGQAPVIGEPIDLFIGGGVSLLRGDHEGAMLSALSAIPGPVGNAAGVAKIARKVGKGVDVVNGNSKASRKAQHAYEVFDTATGDIVKTGVSGGPVTKAGKSYRANSQISKWNKSNPGKYDSRIVKTIPSGKNARAKILKWEKRNADKNRGTLLRKFHQRP